MKLTLAAGVLGAASTLSLAVTDAGAQALRWPLDERWRQAINEPIPECAPSAEGRRVRALLMAFTGGPDHAPPLNAPPNDVAVLRDALLAVGARSEDVLVIVDAPHVLPDGLLALLQGTRCGDTVFIGYSGRGVTGNLWTGEREFHPAEMAEFVTELRNRGAFVVAAFDSDYTLTYWRQPGTNVWRYGVHETAILEPDAGGFAAFLVEGLALEGGIPGSSATYGFLSWHLAAAIRARPEASVADLARAFVDGLTAHMKRLLERWGQPSVIGQSVTVLATHPVFAPFGKTMAPPSVPGPVRIEITSPSPVRGVAVLESRTVRVRGRVVPREGVLAVVVHAAPARLEADGSFEAQVELLPGRQKLAAVAILERTEGSVKTVSSDIDIDVSLPAGLEATGKRWALVIGNAAYREQADGWKELSTPIRDAEEVAKTLREDFGFEIEIPGTTAEEKPFPLLLRNASRSGILRALQRLARTAERNDSVIVYYAGHGYKDEKIGASYWVPIGAKHDDYTDWISESDWNGQVRSFEARHVLVVVDSCFAGAIAMRGEPPAKPPPEAEARRRFIQNAFQRTSRNLLASGADEPVADEGGSGHSVFAGAFLQGLRKYEDNFFTAREVFGKIQPAVAGKVAQLPQYESLRQSGHEGGDFVFVRTPAEPGRVP